MSSRQLSGKSEGVWEFITTTVSRSEGELAHHLAVLVPLPSGRWRTDIPDFPGCSAEHSSALTAMSRARERAEALAAEIASTGDGLPKPRDLQSIIAEESWREAPRLDWKAVLISVLDIRAPRSDGG